MGRGVFLFRCSVPRVVVVVVVVTVAVVVVVVVVVISSPFSSFFPHL